VLLPATVTVVHSLAGCQRRSTVLPVGHPGRDSDWQPEWQAHAAAAGVDSGSAWAIRGRQ